jgi:hypothetical protein
MPTREEILSAARRQKILEDAQALAAQEFQRSQAMPLPRAELPFPTFAPVSQVQAALEKSVAEKAEQEVAQRTGVLRGSVVEAETEFARKAREAAAGPRERMVQPGVERPVQPGVLPIFRPSRIQEMATVALPQGAEIATTPLADLPPQTFPISQLPAPLDPAKVLQEQPVKIQRLYRDPQTGQLRPPTTAEEVIEAFALQTEVSEDRFREEERERARRQREIDRAIEAGEKVPVYSRYVGPLISGILTEPSQGAGVVETPLGAALRSTLGWLSAAAGEGYFRGLGYEVDDKGVPVDPDDLGFEIAKVRRSLGIPDVVTPFGGVEAVLAAGAETFGADAETVQTLRNAIKAVPQLAIPLPGVATQRQTRKVTDFDPEGRRRVTDVEAPPLTSPGELLAFETRRIAENVAKGRTIGDEFLDTPAVREYYAEVSGDENNAYLAGLLPEVFMPSGLGAGARVISAVGGKAADVLKVSDRAKAVAALDRAQTALRAVRADIETVTRSGQAAPTELLRREATAMREVDDLSLQAAAGVSPDVVQNVAVQAIKKVIPEPSRRDAAIVTIKSAKPETAGQVSRALEGSGIAQEDALRVGRLVYLNAPADYVMLTDAIAVPRHFVPAAKKTLNEWRKGMFVRTADEMADDLLARAASTPAAQETLRSTAALLRQAALPPQQFGKRGLASLDPALRKRVETVVRSTARLQGRDPAEAIRLFDQRPPAEVGKALDPAMRDALSTYRSWDEVPAILRRQAIDAHDVGVIGELGKGARTASELTRAQIYFDGLEAGILNTRLLGSPRSRKIIAQYFAPRMETLSAARTAREIMQAGKTSLRTLRARFIEEAKAAGNAEDAYNNLLKNELEKSGEGVEQAWDVLYGFLYGDRAKRNALIAAEQSLGGFTSYPTVSQVRALDRLLADRKIVPGLFQPNVENAFLKVALENGIKKSISATKRDARLAEAATRIGGVEGGLIAGLADTADIMNARSTMLPLPTAMPVEAPRVLAEFRGLRGHVYDPGAGFAEARLAGGVEELFSVLDDIPVRARADTWSYARDGADFILGTGRRNWQQRTMYGYIIPNLPVWGGRLIQMALTPLSTIGAANTLAATQRFSKRAFDAVMRRRNFGGGITDVNGVYYSPKMLENLANDYGLGVTALEAERVGTLATELMRDAKKIAKQSADTSYIADAISMLNPLNKGFFMRVAEALELNFRKSVFEMALARGDAPAEAAELARRSQFDYASTPDVIQQQIGQYIGSSAMLYQLTVESILRVADNPGLAASALNLLRVKAEAQDPFNVHGDKALKSLGIITTDSGTYYLPQTPVLMPVETVLGAARQADKIIEDVIKTYDAEGGLASVYTLGASAGGAGLRVAGELLAPAVVEAYDRFSEGEEYITTGVPDAAPMSDEKVFWALMLRAHLLDPDRLPGGEWDTFTAYFDPVAIQPPDEYKDKETGYWTRQPAEGVPHVYMGMYDGKPQYMVFEPSKRGLKNISVMRNIPLSETAQKIFPIAFSYGEVDPTKAPFAIYPQPVLPETRMGAALETVLPKVSMTPEEARRQQAESVRAIQEQIRVE